MLAGLLEGTRFLSIRQATLGWAAALTGQDVGVEPLDPFVSTLILLVVTLGGFALGTFMLRQFQLRAGD